MDEQILLCPKCLFWAWNPDEYTEYPTFVYCFKCQQMVTPKLFEVSPQVKTNLLMEVNNL